MSEFNNNDFVLVSGASGGIGYQFAKIFAKKGFNLLLCARNEKKLCDIKTEFEKRYNISVEVFAVDLSIVGNVCKLFDYTKEKNIFVKILINNAGVAFCEDFLQSNFERQKNMINLNIYALTEMSYLFGNEMKKNGGGKILNVASAAALFAGPYMSVYFASKSFVLSFSQALYQEMKKYNITVSALCPGPVDTNFEKNSNLEKSNMFTILKPADPNKVALCGYNALMKGKPVKYYGIVVKLMNICERIFPRRISVKAAEFITRKK